MPADGHDFRRRSRSRFEPALHALAHAAPHGLAYDEDKDEYDREVDKAAARDGGTAILDLVPTHKRDDFIGQYTLGAFPPVPPPAPGMPPFTLDQEALDSGVPIGAPPPPNQPLAPLAPGRRLIPTTVMSDC